MIVSEFRLKLYPKNFSVVKEFYRDVLQFPIVIEWDEGERDRGVMFDAGLSIIELLSTDHHVAVSGCDLSLAVQDVWTLWKEFQNKDYIVHSLRENSWGDSSFAIHDPEGFQITFFTKHSTLC